MRRLQHLFIALLISSGIQSASAFGLLGPFAPWMLQPPLSYKYFSATGAPMALGEGYRWNVPVITYGYDQSFLDYFGTNGVAAVESAIQILNDMPPASQIVLTNYGTATLRDNYNAANENLYDLKSAVLSMLVEQMGLARPSESIYCLTNFSYNYSNNLANYVISRRNYDPVTLQATAAVGGQFFDYTLYLAGVTSFIAISDNSSSNGFVEAELYPYTPPGYVSVSTHSSNPTGALMATTVADGVPDIFGQIAAGFYFSAGLTMDDVGGLSYLLSTNNVAMENLIPGVQGAGTNASNYVTKALRPGIDKITFQRMNYLSSNQPVFAAITNQYLDSYFTNGVLHQQTLQRVITQPDILFKANYDGYGSAFRTATGNWVNNGAPLHDGPGVIQGPIVINLNRYGFLFEPGIQDPNNYPPYPQNSSTAIFWGSYDGTTNAPIVYPAVQHATNFTTFRIYLQSEAGAYPQAPSFYTWNLQGQPNARFTLQTSTNLVDWVPLTPITNLGGTFSYSDIAWTNTPTRFFRTVPQ